MKHRAMVVLLTLVGFVPAFAADQELGLTPDERAVTVAYVQSLQKEGGGFAADKDPKTPATLPATSAASRALKYFGGEIKDKEACSKFLRSCYDQESGGLAPTPGGKPNVLTTALGIMAAVELGDGLTKPRPQVYPAPITYLFDHAKTFEDIRIAAAALEAAGVSYAEGDARGWLAEVNKLRNPDGTYGKGGNARETASAVVTVLRLGSTVEHKENIIKALQAGQLLDGGWGKEGGKSDLETTYRVMRAFIMLKEKPKDVAAIRVFVAKCRNADGSYSVQPGQPGNVSATYFAGIILHWLDKMK